MLSQPKYPSTDGWKKRYGNSRNSNSLFLTLLWTKKFYSAQKEK